MIQGDDSIPQNPNIKEDSIAHDARGMYRIVHEMGKVFNMIYLLRIVFVDTMYM